MAATPSTSTRPVTFCSRSYGYCRVGYELPVSGYRFAYRRAVPIRRVFPNSSFWRATRCFVPRVRGLVHTFNDIVINADAWIVSHELELPRSSTPPSRGICAWRSSGWPTNAAGSSCR